MIVSNKALHVTYRALKTFGLTSKRLLVPYYWLPYSFGLGRALPPMTVNLELTYRCNLRCQMCSFVVSNAVVDGGFPMNRGPEGADPKDVRGTEMEYDDYVRLLDELKAFGVRKVNITGGEPLIKKNAPAIIRHAKKCGFWVSMISNGTVMTDEVCDALVSGVDSLTISLDGPEAVHNEVRGTETGFARLVKNVKKLQEWKVRAGKDRPRVGFSCAVSALNQRHLAEIIDVAEECGVPLVGYGYLFFGDEAIDKATDLVTLRGQASYGNQAIPLHLRKMSVEVMKDQLREARAKAQQKGIKVEFNPPLEEHELESRFNDPVYFYTNKCFLPWYETRVNPFGDVYSCQIDTWLGNVRDKSFRRIWNDEPYREFRKLIKEHALLPKCSRCCKLNDRTWDRLPRITLPSWMKSTPGSAKSPVSPAP